jgi:hypothetical protein
VSIEGEFAFVRAVGNFCKSSVRAERFKGNYNFNVKEQIEMREVVERKGESRESVSVAFIGGGGGQIGRLARDMAREEGSGIRVVWVVRVGENPG